ncbi:hypothetical protein GCM10027406_20670 [Leifsonia lichenia]
MKKAGLDCDDRTEPEGERAFPADTPVRISEWLTFPLLYIGMAVAIVIGWSRSGWSPSGRLPVLALASVLVVSAIALIVTGYRAYSTLSARALANLRFAQACTLGACGLVLSFTASPVAAVVLAGAGLRLVGSSGDVGAVRRARLALVGGASERVAILAAVVAFVAQVCVPLASGLGFLPLSILVQLILVAASVVAGFAFASRP